MKINLVSNIGLCFSLAVLWAACGENTSNNERTRSENTIITHACYQAFDYTYENILTKNDLKKHLNPDENSFKINTQNSQDQYGSVTYEWASDRPDQTMEINGMSFPKPNHNFVKLTGLKYYEEDSPGSDQQSTANDLFAQGYKVLSTEEYNSLLANLQSSYETNSEAYKQAKKLLDIRMQSNYEEMNQIGNLAYWKWDQIHGGELVVLHGNTVFQIQAKLSSNPEETREKAILLASEVIAKCTNN